VLFQQDIPESKINNSIIITPDTNMKDNIQKNGPSGAVYGLGFIGAAVYFISHATGFWMGVLGFLKAMVWPAFLVYEAFKHLSM
jgi:hypothetical protein